MLATSDVQLVARASRGEKDAYRQLVEKYQGRVHALAFEILRSREDAEDVAQETFVKAYLSLADFKGNSSFYTWLYRIAYNMAIDFKRKITRRGGQSVGYDEEVLNERASQDVGRLMGSVEGPHEALFRQEQHAHIRQALSAMSEEHRVIVILREVNGLSYEEIAQAIGVSRGTVMSRLHYARKNLQRALAAFAPEGGRGEASLQEESEESFSETGTKREERLMMQNQ